MTDSLARLRTAGVSIWLDDLSRERLTYRQPGRAGRDQHVSGVTTNPTIFATRHQRQRRLQRPDPRPELRRRRRTRRCGN